MYGPLILCKPMDHVFNRPFIVMWQLSRSPPTCLLTCVDSSLPLIAPHDGDDGDDDDQSFPESWKAELDLSILEGNDMFRECFLLHRTTRSVFALDSLVEMGEENIPNPFLRAGSILTGNFGHVSHLR